MTTLLCARCMYDDIDDMSRALAAVTIANGQALCAQHFHRYRNLINPSAGGVALAQLEDPRWNQNPN